MSKKTYTFEQMSVLNREIKRLEERNDLIHKAYNLLESESKQALKDVLAHVDVLAHKVEHYKAECNALKNSGTTEQYFLSSNDLLILESGENIEIISIDNKEIIISSLEANDYSDELIDDMEF